MLIWQLLPPESGVSFLKALCFAVQKHTLDLHSNFVLLRIYSKIGDVILKWHRN